MVIYVCLEGKVNIFVIEGWEEKVLFEIFGFRLEVLCPGFKAQGTKVQVSRSKVQVSRFKFRASKFETRISSVNFHFQVPVP